MLRCSKDWNKIELEGYNKHKAKLIKSLVSREFAACRLGLSFRGRAAGRAAQPPSCPSSSPHASVPGDQSATCSPPPVHAIPTVHPFPRVFRDWHRQAHPLMLQNQEQRASWAVDPAEFAGSGSHLGPSRAAWNGTLAIWAKQLCFSCDSAVNSAAGRCRGVAGHRYCGWLK